MSTIHILYGSLRDFAIRSPALASLATLLVIAAFIRQLRQRSVKLNLPSVFVDPNSGAYDQALQEGFSKYPDTPFVLETMPPLVILPASCVDEVKSLPEHQVSMMKEVRREFSSHVTGIGLEGPDAIPAVRNDLTRNVAKVLDDLQDEVRYSFGKEFGECRDWTPHNVHQRITNVIAILSGRVFVGRPLSREDEWLRISISYTFACIKARDACLKLPPFLRSLVGPYLKDVRNLKALRRRGSEILKPVLEMMIARQRRGEKYSQENWEDEQGNMCAWMLKYAGDKEAMTPQRLASNQMGLSFAAIHTSATALTQAIYDLASRPEYIQPLREEIKQAIVEDGEDIDANGHQKLKKTSLNKLRKLDSFMKESQRLSPPIIISLQRVTTSPLTLSTGLTLPTGTRFAFPSYNIHLSSNTPTFSSAYNPPSYKLPLEFDGFRFSKLREMAGKENKHQFVTTSTDSLIFGHGMHACPGRFFASNEIKITLIELLRYWDIRIPSGIRPANIVHGFAVVPDTNTVVEFRRLLAEQCL